VTRAQGHSELNVLQDGNNLPSNPVDRTLHVKDSRDITAVLIFIQYNKYCWNICEDSKVTVLVLDMQLDHVYAPHVKKTATQDQSSCCNYMASQYTASAGAEHCKWPTCRFTAHCCTSTLHYA
jgi:hypothetical protein